MNEEDGLFWIVTYDGRTIRNVPLGIIDAFDEMIAEYGPEET
jgi:hypothetical protein